MFSVKCSVKYYLANGKNSLFRITELHVNNDLYMSNVTGYITR